ncbi:MAG TPA: TlpA disulfide reductase family protein [Mycobacteriales bacterium]|nr:TlpA disulfide reductase family protein [Mycobacteriales bacterium]HWA67558.1 TlpA disulfide reductase family protein [Mycobacteriales bacterium]
MRVRGSLLLVAALVAATGCASASGGGDGTGHSSPPSPKLASLVRAARLAPCPASSSADLPDGLPNLTLDCLGNGPSVHLAGLRGPAVVNVWGSWCGPCGKEAGYLSTVYDEDRGRVTFLGIDTEDSVSDGLAFGTAVRPPVRYPSVSDPDRKFLIDLAKAPGPPETAFVGTSGRVVHVHLGAYDSAAELRADISTYLGVT